MTHFILRLNLCQRHFCSPLNHHLITPCDRCSTSYNFHAFLLFEILTCRYSKATIDHPQASSILFSASFQYQVLTLSLWSTNLQQPRLTPISFSLKNTTSTPPKPPISGYINNTTMKTYTYNQNTLKPLIAKWQWLPTFYFRIYSKSLRECGDFRKSGADFCCVFYFAGWKLVVVMVADLKAQSRMVGCTTITLFLADIMQQ